MAEEKTLNGVVDTEQATAQTSGFSIMDSKREAENIRNEQDTSKRMDRTRSRNSVPYYKLFSFADSLDYLLMFAGTAGAIVNGMSMPLMTLIFGNLVNSFGGNGNTKEVVCEVSKVCCYTKY